MKSALVFHPVMSVYSGGEILCVYVCKALQELGYEVYLMCDEYNPTEAGKRWGPDATGILRKCHWIPWKMVLPVFRYGRKYQLALLKRLNWNNPRIPDVSLVIGTQQFYDGLPLIPHFAIFYDKRTLSGLSDVTRDHTTFIPITRLLESQLNEQGLRHSSVVYPPCQESFKPREKSNLVVQVSRLNPGKHLEEFVEIARRLPEYTFVLVYTVPEYERKVFPGYEEEFRSKNLPSNLRLVREFILKVPVWMEEAKVYLYTGHEPGTTTSLGQAMLAGCFPVVSPGGARDMIQSLGYGFTYNSVEDAVEKVKLAMKSIIPPETIAEKAKMFSPEVFVEKIKRIVSA